MSKERMARVSIPGMKDFYLPYWKLPGFLTGFRKAYGGQLPPTVKVDGSDWPM